MSSRVTAIIVARGSARGLQVTLDALAAQRRPADRVVVVDATTLDEVRAVARAATPDLIVAVASDSTFGGAIDEAVAELAERAPDALEEGWLWFFEDGDDAEPDALELLLATCERNPSLAVTGPKLISAADETVIEELGQTVERSAVTVRLHHGELDQGQHDDASDVLGVARNGMLVSASMWVDLEGFDDGLRDVDDSLDFGARAWLTDGRVIVTPQARVRVPERAAPSRRRARASQLHRVVASSSGIEYVARRAALIPIAIVGIIWNLIRKDPGRILPDLAAAAEVAFGRTRVGEAQARMRGTSTQPPRVVERLMLSKHDLRSRQLVARDERREADRDERDRYDLVGTGGAWVLLTAAVLSAVLLLPMFGRGALTGGALLPLSVPLGELWSNVGYGVIDEASGAFGTADPFVLVLAVLGTVTFWNPSTSVVVLWLLAMPLAALTAWVLAARLTLRPWLRAFAAFAWMLAPPLTSALADGRIQTVIVHILLPLLAFCALRGSRRWTGIAQASLVAAAVLACAPSLWPAMLLLWVVAIFAGGRRWYRQLFLLAPALALFAPLAVAQWNRGRPLAILADPGLPLAADPARGAVAALGFPDARLGGWAASLSEAAGGVEPAVLLAVGLMPLAMLAVLGLVLPAWRVAAWSLAIALLGFATAVLAGGLSFATLGPTPVPLSIGPAQSMLALGLLGAAIAGLAVASRAFVALSVVALVGLGTLSAPAAISHLTGAAAVRDAASDLLPAIVEAQARVDDALGTLIITPLADGSMRVRLDRGMGERLDEQSTLRTTAVAFSTTDDRLAELAVTLLSDPAAEPTSELHALGIAFILVEPAAVDATDMGARLASSLDANPMFQSAGESGAGTLWRVANPTVAPADEDVAAPLAVGNLDTWVGRGILIGLALVVVTAVLLALPTGRAPVSGEAATPARAARITIDPPGRAAGRRFGARPELELQQEANGQVRDEQ